MARYFVPFAAAILSLSLPLHAEDAPPRIVHAEIAALDQMLVYNRFGSFNPFGMIFALTRDLSPADAPRPSRLSPNKPKSAPPAPAPSPGLNSATAPPATCASRIASAPVRWSCAPMSGTSCMCACTITSGAIRCPRPPHPTSAKGSARPAGAWMPIRPPSAPLWPRHRRPLPKTWTGDVQHQHRHASAETKTEDGSLDLASAADWPMTRGVNLVFQGLTPVAADGTEGASGLPPACLGLGSIPPGETVDCYWRADQEGTYFGASTAARAAVRAAADRWCMAFSAPSWWNPKTPSGSEARSPKPPSTPPGHPPPAPPACARQRAGYQVMEGDTPILNILRDVTPTADGWVATGLPTRARQITLKSSTRTSTPSSTPPLVRSANSRCSFMMS